MVFTFAHPGALWALVLVALPWLLASTRRRPRRVVSSLALWDEAPRPASSGLVARPRWSWLSAVQSSVIAAMVLAWSGPGVAAGPDRVTLVFDASATMGTVERGGTSRLDTARARARAVLRSIPSRTRVSVVRASGLVATATDFAAGDRALERTIAALATGDTAADIEGALAEAVPRDGQVFVFSDRPRPSALDVPRIEWIQVGEPVANLAIVRTAFRRVPRAPTDVDLLVGVRNDGATAADTSVAIVQEKLLARAPLTVPAGGEATVVLRLAGVGGIVRAELPAADALASDDRRWVALPPPRRVRVGYVPGPSDGLRTALAVDPTIALSTIARTPDGTVPSPADPVWQAHDVVVCDGCDDPPRLVNTLVVPPVVAASDPGPLTLNRPEHAIAAGIDVGDLSVVPAQAQMAAAPDDVILRAGSRAAVVAGEHDGRRTVTFNVDLRGAGLVLTPAFPLLVANTVEWLATAFAPLAAVTAGEPLMLTLPDGVASSSVTATGPDERPRTFRVVGRQVLLDDTERAGVYRVAAPSAGWRSDVVVNAASASSAPRRARAASGVSDDEAMRPADAVWSFVRLCALAAIVLLAIEWRLRRMWTMDRALAVSLLVLVAAGLALWRRPGPMDVIAVVDRSASMAEATQRDADDVVARLATTLRGGDRLGVVAFGADAAVVSAPSGQPRASGGRAVAVAGTGTDIAAGLRLGRTLAAATNRRLLLLSDGRATTGDEAREARLAAAQGVAIDVVAPDAAVAHAPIEVLRLVTPSERRSREPFPVAVEMRGAPGDKGLLSVYRDDALFAETPVAMDADGRAYGTFASGGEMPGRHIFRAVVRGGRAAEAGDTRGDGSVTIVADDSTVLHVAAGPRVLRPVLGAAGFGVRSLAPRDLPATAAGFSGVDAVVLDDVSADDLSAFQLGALTAFVERGGGGLLLVGTPRALDRGGYPTTALGPMLPVDVTAQSGRRAPGLNLVLVFDKSGSMADQAQGVPHIDLARRAVMGVLDVVPASDALGVIAFDAEATAIAPLAVGRDAGAIARRLDAIAPAGPTRIAPAVRTALQWLREGRGIPSARSRILLVSDGQTTPEDAAAAMEAVRGAGVEISTVAIGARADRDLLRGLAETTGGMAWFPDNVQDLPRIVSREAARSTAGATVQEPFTPQPRPHPALAGLDGSVWPRLDGYVVGATRPTASAVLVSHLGDPIVGVWRVGLGRVGVLTVGLDSAWASNLVRWSQFTRFSAQLVRWVARRATERALSVDLAVSDGALRIAVDAVADDGSPATLREGMALVQLPSGAPARVPLVQTAPGFYEARHHLVATGAYIVDVSAIDAASGAERRVVRGIHWGANEERVHSGPDLARLRRLAELSGGHVLRSGESPFDLPRAPATVDVSRWAIAAALGLFVLALVRAERGRGAVKAAVVSPSAWWLGRDAA